MDAAELLRQARRRTGLSQREFAARAGVSERSLAGAESGGRPASWTLVEQACRAAGLDVTAALPTGDLEAETRRHLEQSLTQRVWLSFGGQGRPLGRYGPRAATRPTGWCRLVEVAQSVDVVLLGTEALRAWLPAAASAGRVGPDCRWTEVSVCRPSRGSTTHSKAALLRLPPGVRVVDVLPCGLVPVPLAEPRPHVLVPTPAELALDPACAEQHDALRGVATVLHEQSARDVAGRRTPSHRDPNHGREHADVWHDKRFKPLPMPPAHDTRSWRLFDDASHAAWLGQHGLHGYSR